MDDDSKRKPLPETLPNTTTQARSRPFAEPKPIEVVVLPDTETVDDVVVETEVKQRTKVRRWTTFPFPARPEVPQNFWLLLIVAALALVFSWHWVLSPLVAHAEHTVQRRIYGERTYEAPTSNPHVHRQKKPILGFRVW